MKMRLPAAAAVALAGIALLAGATAPAAASGGRQLQPLLSVQGELVGVTTISSSDAWAVGDTTTVRDKPLLAHWDGTRWAKVKSPALPALGQLYDVTKFAGGAFAVGFAGAHDAVARPLILRLTGTRVRRMQVPAVRGGLLVGVSAVSARDAWAVGLVSRGSALILHWNGSAWRRMKLPGRFSAQALADVAATSAKHAWAVGNSRTGGPVILRWNGSRWSRVAFPAPGGAALQLLSVTANAAANAWATGWTDRSTGTAVTVALHWAGGEWRRIRTPNPTGGSDGDGFLGVTASSARHAWAVGGGFEGLDGELLIERWNGNSWRAVRTPATPGNLYAVAVGPSGRGWAVGQTLAPTEAEGIQTLILHWNGTSWRG
jgi:hypothetical protein